MPHPVSGVMEKAFTIVNMLQGRKSITAYDVMDECAISRSTAHKYLTAATLVMPVIVLNEERAIRKHERFQYALLRD